MSQLSLSDPISAQIAAGVAPLVFAAGGAALLGSGPIGVESFARADDPHWAEALVASLAEPESIAFAALPFRRAGSATVLRPAGIARHTQPELDKLLGATAPALPSIASLREEPSREHYMASVRTAVQRIDRGDFAKTVLGRWLDVRGAGDFDARAVLAALSRRNPGQHVFSIPMGEDEALLGASPELLISRRGAQIRSMPLAGSAARSADPEEDRRRAAALRGSAKDRHEHDFVVAAILDVLSPLCDVLDAPSDPQLVSTDTMWHLATPITGTLRGPASEAPSALRLAQLLHPTPAVGGSPRVPAEHAIAELEPLDRGLLTGAVGWVNGAGDGDWAVTIRAGLLRGNQLRLFAGAGIVRDSDPASEADETRAKLDTMLRAIGA